MKSTMDNWDENIYNSGVEVIDVKSEEGEKSDHGTIKTLDLSGEEIKDYKFRVRLVANEKHMSHKDRQ